MAKKQTNKNPKAKRVRRKAGGKGCFPWLTALFRGVACLAMILLMSLVCIFAYDWVTQCAYFSAEEIHVEGCRRLDPEEIRNIAGVSKGVNILSVNLASAKKRLTAEPWIADAGIRRAFPSKISIVIREHDPVAVIGFGRLFLINREGRIFKEYDRSDPDLLPVISGVDYRKWAGEGAWRKRIFGSVMDVLKIAEQKGSAIGRERIEKIIVDSEIGLTLQTRQPVTRIELGFGEYEKKFERFERVVAYLAQTAPEKSLSRVDLRNPDRIVAGPAGEDPVIAGKGGASEGT